MTCTFTNKRKPSSIDVTKTPDPSSVNEPGGNVKYTVGVTNTSAADKVKLTESSFVDKVAKNGAGEQRLGHPDHRPRLQRCHGR